MHDPLTGVALAQPIVPNAMTTTQPPRRIFSMPKLAWVLLGVVKVEVAA